MNLEAYPEYTEEIDFWQEEYPELTREEILDILLVIDESPDLDFSEVADDF